MAVEQLITQHIDTWTSALRTRSTAGRGASGKIDLYGIKKLRELILELAVRGKLVPQDSNDEPASELLKRIAAEKAELVKQGKIKKQKPLPEISEDEKPFALPKGWEWTALKNICLLENGDRSKNYPNKSTLVESGVPFVNAGHLVNGGIDENEMTFIKNEHFNSLRSGKFHHGDILFCLRGSLGKSALVDNLSGAIASSLVIVRTLPLVNNEYVNLYFNTPVSYRYIKKYDNGTAQPNLAATDLERFLVPLASLSEQKRIIAKINELMSLCDQLEQQSLTSLEAHSQLVETLLSTLTDSQNAEELAGNWARVSEHFDTLFTTEASIDALKQTILQLAVMGKLVPQDPNDEPASELLKRIEQEKAQLVKEGKIKKQKPLPPVSDEEKPFELPVGWEWCRIGDIIENMDAGWSPACLPEPSPNEKVWGVLKTTAVQTLEYREQENKTLPNSKQPRPQYEVKVGDILITRAGPKNRVGISCLVGKTRGKLMISDKIIRFHLISADISAKYISLCLNCGVTAEYLESSKSGMAESQMNISQDNLKFAPVALPPTKIQLKVILTVEDFFSTCDSLKSRLQSAQQTQLHLADALTDAALS
ncbi:restriction endonuclease subunit S [Serratia proteamaculans]|uniref:Restriction endonuclease subunit S n=1 Tax=Serratia proteamaculans TaxID=28151 RepID=A0ABS0TNY8_SERPR|nr:restriction endonuclease subunit S [Serratia proteamaculans]MBI6180068.1 restriction endonuclease subunit S [Serratia proteamaculans]